MPRDNHIQIKAEDWDRIFGKKEKANVKTNVDKKETKG
jgi:hypothetical protein